LTNAATHSTVTFESRCTAAQEHLQSDTTLHVTSLQQSKDKFEQELAAAHAAHLEQFDQKLKDFRDEMSAFATNLRGSTPQHTHSARDEDADEEDNGHSDEEAAASPPSGPPSGNETDPPQPHQ
jgi:hypothetical protein